jgi:2-hydroxy-3-keto-5-methylthiopentenyl-1-phosphate phosphatase
MRNIAIVWDFDKTLTPEDSTSIVIDIILGKGEHSDFWNFIKRITGKEDNPEWEQLLGSDAPAWMYSLSRVANEKGIPLNAEFFQKFVVKEINLFSNVVNFLTELKNLSKLKEFKSLKIQIHHFIITAGLQHLVEQIFPKGLITHTFGCRYQVLAFKGYEDQPESIPVFCMDETMKTRALFEISKGSFKDPEKPVNKRVEEQDRFAPFNNIIYIGDGPTDIPSLSLTRYNGGMGVVVYDKKSRESDIQKKLESMSLDKRADLITPADYSTKSELFDFLKTRCIQIRQRYEAENR